MMPFPGVIDMKSAVSCFGPAGVIEKDETGGRYQVSLSRHDGEEGIFTPWARLAIPLPRELQCGETVLVAGGNDHNFYIIGVLDFLPAEPAARNCLELPGGGKAEITGTPAAEKLRVFSGAGRCIFEYDPYTEKSRVDAPAGDLELQTGDGDIVLNSSKSIRLVSSGGSGEGISALTLDSAGISLTGPGIGVATKKGDIYIGEARYAGKVFSGRIDTVRLVMDRLESVTGTAVQKMKNLYQTVEELAQVQAGRMRTLVAATWHMKSKKMFLKAEDDVKIKGEKIYLG
ncbi:MAG: DUF3540 domain-containing protein [Candidatus Latescibacterota bacterium]